MKKILICFISVIAIIHSLNTVIYNLPTNPTQEKYNKYTNFYMTILFEQNWTLFAPTPINTNNYLNVRFGDTKKELVNSKWTNLTKYYQTDFRKRYLHTSFYKNTVITQLESDVLENMKLRNDKKFSNKELKKDQNVKSLYRYVYEELKKKSLNPKYLEISYEIEYLPNFKDRNRVNKEIRIEKLPVYDTREWSEKSETNK
ncbi:DUF5819 family protein [Staphylococcus succinus]|uniref:DUF5819 family protein n=2 Tax=Staphylococcus succinus TaxID=61015 RepID=UPI002DBC5685|nr:DUF5819 family protein [Staphylococcus succinus]MEB8209481.1 DUF5819 family protein [Staphylococcus succinus]